MLDYWFYNIHTFCIVFNRFLCLIFCIYIWNNHKKVVSLQRKLVKLYKSMNTTIITTEEKSFIESLKQIVRAARRMAYTAIDYAQIQSNWLIGQRVVEQMQKGAERAEYGAHVIKIASEALTEEFGSGYSETNIHNFRTSIWFSTTCKFSRHCLTN